MVTIFGVFLICRLMQGDMTAEKDQKNVCLKGEDIGRKVLKSNKKQRFIAPCIIKKLILHDDTQLLS